MQIDLSGYTVTQALKELTEAIEAHGKPPKSGSPPDRGQSIIFKLDNETVKLNLFQSAVRRGLKCTSKRSGLSWLLTVKLPKKGIVSKEISEEETTLPNLPKVASEWWIVQTDQVGQKDHTLGHQLQVDLVLSLMTRPIGIYFVHRGTLLLNCETLNKASKTCRATLWACPKSLEFYKINMPHMNKKDYTSFLFENRKLNLIFS